MANRPVIEAKEPQATAQKWPSLSNADRSRLLQTMTADQKRSLRDAIQRSKKRIGN